MATTKTALVTVDEALAIIRKSAHQSASVKMPLREARSRVLADDVCAEVSLPPFDQSAMDGYAVNFASMKEQMRVNGFAPAGKRVVAEIAKNEAVRIFTGAMMPAGADTVIKQEDVNRAGENISFEVQAVQQGQNVRLKGEQIKKGNVALAKGTMLNDGAIGYLSALGISSVAVIQLPKVSVIVTGNELKSAGEILEDGEIYESNSNALISALKSQGIIDVEVRKAEDSPEIVRIEVEHALKNSDVVLITGGVSVGELDYTTRVLNELGVESKFHGVAQRPGKPLYFGIAGEKIVFGLPGNPASVLSCFYIYVIPALRAQQATAHGLTRVILPVSNSYGKPANLTCFLKGKIEGDHVRILPGQESFILSSFAEADCLVEAPSGTAEIQVGDKLNCYILP